MEPGPDEEGRYPEQSYEEQEGAEEVGKQGNVLDAGVVPFRDDDIVIVRNAMPELVVAILFYMGKIRRGYLGIGETGRKRIVAVIGDQLPLFIDGIVFRQVLGLLVEQLGDQRVIALVVLGLGEDEEVAGHLSRGVVTQGLAVDIGILIEGSQIVFEIGDIGVLAAYGKDGIEGIIG
jgi:hypothetical protein